MSNNPPVCCYCDHDLSCDHCGMEQPYTDVSVLKAALRPFAAFADPRNTIPPDTILTAGSAMARKQITMADCYAARDALAGISGVARSPTNPQETK